MRTRMSGGLIVTLTLTVGAWGVSARQHEHGQQGQPADPKAKPAAQEAVAEKKDPNRPKPENQPGKVMNAEELAASHADHHELQTYDGGGVLPEGWKNRFDLTNMKLENIRFMAAPSSLHVTTGPPGIYYNPTMTASGSFTVRATFTQLAKGEHREGYGPFVGGADLAGPDQRYTYFLVRQDGKFLVKQRTGVNTKGVTDWAVHPAIKSFGADGKMTNELAIVVDADSVRFLINGTEVQRQPRADMSTDGVFGLRVNHNLDVQVDGFGVQPSTSH